MPGPQSLFPVVCPSCGHSKSISKNEVGGQTPCPVCGSIYRAVPSLGLGAGEEVLFPRTVSWRDAIAHRRVVHAP